MRIREIEFRKVFRVTALVLVTGLLPLLFTQCSSPHVGGETSEYRYFGNQGTVSRLNHHYVPKEVKRTDPWLPLF